MYNYEWDAQTGGFILNTKMAGVTKELRPVFFEELDLLGFSKYWKYPKTDNPLLWAETRRYIYKGRLVAEAAGGGLFTAPELKIYEDGLELEPVDVDGMVVKNRDLMSGVVQNTLEIIYNTFKRYKERKYDIFYVAFSGGKDSLVLLDLVQRALPHNEFKVVFADTTMEVSDTYKAVEEAKKCWPTLEFHTARSDYDAKESWELFGPPSIKQRWCCSVHKSAPSLLLLRKLIGKDNLKALVFDGVRAEESDARAAYSLVSDGTKHVIQSNCSPLRDWNSSELFLYILENDLLMNKMYRQGSIRVGCMMCPMSSKWQQFILNTVYKSDVTPFLNIIDKNAKIKISSQKERKNYLENRGWKSRVGGRDLKIGGNRIVEQYENNILTLYVNEIHCNWRDWIKPLGDLIESNRNNYVLIYRDQYYQFSVNETNRRIIVSLHIGSKTKESIRFVYLFKNVFYKVAYCIGCKVCMVECPVGALSTDNNGVTVKNSCKHCESCLDMPKGCLVAKSLYITERGAKMNSKGINRYQTFGFRKEWLMYFYEMADRFWESRGKGRLGPYMFDGFKVWLKEAEITENNSLTQFGREIERLGVNDIRVWAIILNNLTYNSTIMRWYIQNADFGIRYEIEEIVTMLGEDYSISTKQNAIKSLKETFKTSPIGLELGVGNYELKGKNIISLTRTGWQNPDSLVILYSLYKFAEKSEGYYSFTFTELVNDNPERVGISPAQIFGIDKELLKRIIQGLAFDYPDFITVAFNKDLDNINLNKNKTSLDVVKLF